MSPGEMIFMSSNQAYNLWSSTYDTDGNILQAVDDHQITHDLFPRVIDDLLSDDPALLTITDLGAGTGRASLAFISALTSYMRTRQTRMTAPLTIHLHLLDASTEMLRLARSKVGAAVAALPATTGEQLRIHLSFLDHDISSAWPPADVVPAADLVFSTLVLEHLPIPTFFSAVRAATKPSGLAVVTNMHSAMGLTEVKSTWVAPRQQQGDEVEEEERPRAGAITGAGFKDGAGRKVRVAEDYAHLEAEVEGVAMDEGLQVVGARAEVRVTPDMLDGGEGGSGAIKIGERGEKWRGVKVWAGWVFHKEVMSSDS